MVLGAAHVDPHEKARGPASGAARLEAKPEKTGSLPEMERTGGEPDAASRIDGPAEKLTLGMLRTGRLLCAMLLSGTLGCAAAKRASPQVPALAADAGWLETAQAQEILAAAAGSAKPYFQKADGQFGSVEVEVLESEVLRFTFGHRGRTATHTVPFAEMLEPVLKSRTANRYVELQPDWRFGLQWPHMHRDDAETWTAAAAKLWRQARGRGTPESPAEAEAFEKVAREYRAKPVKPALPEEARKYKVQAEFAVEQKRFPKAVQLYEQALELAPWWPDGHFNRALILGETGRYPEAISAMKKYLALEPEASDARAAQDKIYQWESVLPE
jgi:tetratricopeptide (TPR) repeat protein